MRIKFKTKLSKIGAKLLLRTPIYIFFHTERKLLSLLYKNLNFLFKTKLKKE